MLRVFAAQNRHQGANALLLADNIFKFLGPHMLGQGLSERNRPHLPQIIHFPAAFPARQGLRLALIAQLRVKKYARYQRDRHLDEQQKPAQKNPPFFCPR